MHGIIFTAARCTALSDEHICLVIMTVSETRVTCNMHSRQKQRLHINFLCHVAFPTVEI
jgi:hypothetical protein